MIKEVIDKLRQGKTVILRGIRGIGKTFILRAVEESLSLSGKYVPIRISLTPLLDFRKKLFWKSISRVKEKTGITSSSLAKLADRLKAEGYLQLPDAVTNREYQDDERILDLLTAIEKDLAKSPILLMDDIHYLQKNSASFPLLTNFPSVFACVVPPVTLNRVDMDTSLIRPLHPSEFHGILQERIGMIDESGVKALKQLTGGIPSYLMALLPKLSDWVKRKEMSLDNVIVKKVWEEEMENGILSLIARAYVQSYLSLFGKEAVKCLVRIARDEEGPTSPYLKSFRHVGLVRNHSLVDKVLETWFNLSTTLEK